MEKVRLHRELKTSSIIAKFRFNSRTHTPDESVTDYVAAIRRLAELCAYGEILEEMLHDRLVCDINNAVIQGRLLAESDSTLSKAVSVAQTAKIADTVVKQLVLPWHQPQMTRVCTNAPLSVLPGQKTILTELQIVVLNIILISVVSSWENVMHVVS